MPFEVILTFEAERNVRSIRDWIADQSRAGAMRWLDALDEAKSRLGSVADSFGLAPESGLFEEPIRQIVFKTPRGTPYRALYVLRKHVAIVLAVRGKGQPFVNPIDVVLPD